MRVISAAGKNIGVLSKEEALKLAAEDDLDLVEIAPKALPPVCKIVNFKKFQYEQRKKERKGRKKSSRPEVKEIRITLFMAAHDLQRRIKQAEKFLKKGELVKFRLLFKGREISKREIGLALFSKISQELKAVSQVSLNPQIKGKILEMTLKASKS